MKPQIKELTHPLIKHKLSTLRDKITTSQLFRLTLQEITTILCIESTTDLKTKDIEIQTPLTNTTCQTLSKKIGIVPILRAGLGMSEAILKLIPEASVWHLGFYRDEKTLKPVEYYNKLPKQSPVETCLIVDPMLATGGSAIAAINIIKNWGVKNIKFLSIISSAEGIDNVIKAHEDVKIYTAQIDKELTKDHDTWSDGFILPGLGDAGDRIHST